MLPPITLSTPLPPADLQFESMTFSSGLSVLEDMQLRMLSEKSDIAPDKLLGQQVDVKIVQRDGSTRHFNGFVSRFGQGRHQGRYFGYRPRSALGSGS